MKFPDHKSPEKDSNTENIPTNIPERGFCGCYLLNSVNQRAVSLGGRTYIGFTVDPRRRIRQHNGILTQGAYKTRKWRPWDLVLVVHGFANQRTALQFEWTWQHAETSLDTREAILGMKMLINTTLSQKKKKDLRLSGVVGQILILFVILSTPPWKHFPLHIRCMTGSLWRMVGDAIESILGKDNAVRRGLSPGFMLLPDHMSVSIGPLDDFKYEILESHAADTQELVGIDFERARALCTPSPVKLKGKKMKIRCVLCCELAQRTWAECHGCGCRTHVACLAEHFLQINMKDGAHKGNVVTSSGTAALCIGRQKDSLPTQGVCPQCGAESSWERILATLKTVGWRKQGNKSKNHDNTPLTERDSAPDKPLKDDIEHTPSKPQLLEAKTPLESLILKTRSLSFHEDDSNSLAFRMLQRLREEGTGGTVSPKRNDADLQADMIHCVNGSKNDAHIGISRIDPPIINLCSSEEYSDIIDLVEESPGSVNSNVQSGASQP